MAGVVYVFLGGMSGVDGWRGGRIDLSPGCSVANWVSLLYPAAQRYFAVLCFEISWAEMLRVMVS